VRILSGCFSFHVGRLSDVFPSFYLCGLLAGIDAGSLPLTSDGLSDSKSRGRSRASGAGAGAGSGGPVVSIAYASPEEVVHAWSELAKLYGFIGDEEVRVRNQYERAKRVVQLRSVFALCTLIHAIVSDQMLRAVVDKTSRDPRTSDAISLELRGSYIEARGLYDELIKGHVGEDRCAPNHDYLRCLQAPPC
jgi:hypothetical protein